MKFLLVLFTLLAVSFSGEYTEKCFSSIRAEKLKEAVSEGLKAVKEEPNSAESHFCLGLAYRLTGKFKDSLASFQKALKLVQAPEDEMILHNYIGLNLFYMGRWQEAEDHYLKAYQLSEKLNKRRMRATVANNLGLLYDRRGDYDKAIKFYNLSLELTDNEAEKAVTYNNLALIYTNKGDLKSAKEGFESAVKIARKYNKKRDLGTYLINLGEIYRKEKDLKKAESTLREGLEIVQQVGDKYWEALGRTYLGTLYAQQGRVEEALKNLKKARIVFLQSGDKESFEFVDAFITELERAMKERAKR